MRVAIERDDPRIYICTRASWNDADAIEIEDTLLQRWGDVCKAFWSVQHEIAAVVAASGNVAPARAPRPAHWANGLATPTAPTTGGLAPVGE